jgi:hypothetical protein
MAFLWYGNVILNAACGSESLAPIVTGTAQAHLAALTGESAHIFSLFLPTNAGIPCNFLL